MGITSLYYFCLLAVGISIYYIIPKKCRWVWILVLSVGYFLTTGSALLLLFPVLQTGAAYLSGIGMDKAGDGEEAQNSKKGWMLTGVTGNLICLVICKYLNFGLYTYNGFIDLFNIDAQPLDIIRIAVPIGMSFYTLSLIGYVLDIYYGGIEAERDPLRLLTYSMYFPAIVSGPILRYGDIGKSLFEGHSYDHKQITFGLQRIFWGCFKVLVISSRLNGITAPVFGNSGEYSSLTLMLAALAFVMELYTNFSGSIDIIMGASECLGIKLPENFNSPFLSKSVQEFWRRWHITLGDWVKVFIFYPLLRTEYFRELPARLKKGLSDKLPGRLSTGFSKKTAKTVTTFTAMFILWLSVGLWHGGSWKYLVGSGILHWFYILLEETGEPLWSKLRAPFKGRVGAFVLRVWQSVRTYLLISIAFVFFNSGSLRAGFSMLADMIANGSEGMNASALIAGKDAVILIFSLLILSAVDLAHTLTDVREWIAARPLPVRWIIYYALIFMVILLGNYGPGYDAAEFIYRGF
ncbi:MAG: MBOAT family protein [Lachnospiraceae bacterium]|nr:MBOAT family protein [Lachnospiraceae bacterium]